MFFKHFQFLSTFCSVQDDNIFYLNLPMNSGRLIREEPLGRINTISRQLP